jgi:exodeoxyribonuclease VII small subunit
MSEQPEQDDVAYSDAIEQLETILDEIEDDEVDLDDLAVKVERASELVSLCRDKIDDTEMQVKTIIDDLQTDDEDES